MTTDKSKSGQSGKGTTPPTPESHEPAQPTLAQFAQSTRRRPGLYDVLSRKLQDAVKDLSASRVEKLLATRVDVNAQDENGMTALHHAAARGARPCIRLLVNSGRCDYLVQDKQGRYAFELAIEWARDHAVARLLMKKQAQQAARLGVAAYVPRT